MVGRDARPRQRVEARDGSQARRSGGSTAKGQSLQARDLAACKALYVAYQALADNSASTESAYQHLLDASRGKLSSVPPLVCHLVYLCKSHTNTRLSPGGPGSQRLAARFISKFALRHPAKLTKAIDCLEHLLRVHDVTAESLPLPPANIGTRGDALEGLGSTAGELYRLGHTDPAMLQRIMLTLLRCLYLPCCCLQELLKKSWNKSWSQNAVTRTAHAGSTTSNCLLQLLRPQGHCSWQKEVC